MTRGAGVTVAVVDTGVEADHQDLAGSVLPGNDYVEPGRRRPHRPRRSRHARRRHHRRARQQRPRHRRRRARREDPAGARARRQRAAASSSNVAKGIIWAADHGARVINLSLGGGHVAGHAAGDAVREQQGRGRAWPRAATTARPATRRSTRPRIRKRSRSARSTATSRTRRSPTPAATSTSSAPGVGICVDVGHRRPPRTPTRAARRWRRRTRRPKPRSIISANRRSRPHAVAQIMEIDRDDLGLGLDSVFGHGLINPAAAVRASAQPHPKGYGAKGNGYWIVSSDGRVRTFGGAQFYGDLGGARVARADRRVGLAPRAATATGSPVPTARSTRSATRSTTARWPDTRLTSPIVGMAATPKGNGYILLGADGGIFTFGDAKFYGSTGGMRLNARVLDLAMTAERQRLLVRRGRRRRVLVRRRAVPRLDRQHAPRGAGDVDDGREQRPRLLDGRLRRRDLRLQRAVRGQHARRCGRRPTRR